MADLQSWHEGNRLYDNDDYQSMMRCATLLSAALAHNLYGEGILNGDDLPETVRRILYASVEKPPDGRSFGPGPQKCARLALTIVRENGWQPKPMGGNGLLDKFILASGSRELYGVAIAGQGELVGNLKEFFSVQPEAIEVQITDSRREFLDGLLDMVKKADDGDQASQLHTQALGLWRSGDLPAAMSVMEQAARLGDAHAMKSAGDLASDMGQASLAKFWFESAAEAGEPGAMFNMGAFAIRAGDTSSATIWYQRAAEAGDTESFAVLTQLAHDRGDPVAERDWAKRGADAGQAWCVFNHGLFLAMDANGDTVVLRKALAFLEAAAEGGDVDGMMMAGNVRGQLGDGETARQWYGRAHASGNPKALEMLQKYGL